MTEQAKNRLLRIEAIKNIQPQIYMLKDISKREAKTLFQNFESIEKAFEIDFFKSKDTNKMIRKKTQLMQGVLF